ncbi:MAG TPA: acyltransferase [Stellaceae bacterium]|nr:acyltransferase [Stellaceae bacterium]
MKTLALDAAAPSTAAAVPRVTAHPYRVLGAYRFLLASLVLVSHASGFLPGFVGPLALGNVGVLLFFVVSGFVISEALDIFYRRSTTKFLLNRALKIYPAYLAAVPVAYAARLWAGETADWSPFGIAVNLGLLPAYLPHGNTLLVISVAWAVIVECQFYLLAAAAFATTRLLPRMPVLPLAAAASLILYLWVWRSGAQARFYGAFQFAPFFILGALLYFRLARGDARLSLPAAVAFLLAVHAYFGYNARGLAAGPSFHVTASTAIFITVFLLMVGLTTLRASRAAERIDKRLGDLTYALYLVHPSVIFAVITLHLGNSAAFGLTVAASFALAVLIRILVERPIVRLRNSLRGYQLYDR